MIDFNKILWGQILIFCRVLQSSSSSNLETIERWFKTESSNFKEILNFLCDLGIIKIVGRKILPSIIFKKSIALNDEGIRRFFLDTLLQNKNNRIKYFGDFFNNFELRGDEYEFIPDLHKRLKYSGIRNFLISLGVLEFESGRNKYKATKELSSYLLDRDRVLPYNEFIKKIRSIEELGRAAELLIFDFEKSKFKNKPTFLREIRHVSLEDVTAGYDIKSFERHKDGSWSPKFIEVKAVSESDWRFYWSKNEISKAKQIGKSYYLYLLPVKSKMALDISLLKQIKDPYREVFQNTSIWAQEVETITFYKK